VKVCILGPSKKFLSGVSYYTIRLSNALSEYVDVYAILFRNMLPKRLFPGWRRVGKDLTTLTFKPEIKVYEILDWYNPLTWLKAWSIIRNCDAVVFQWWTSSVAHMYVAIEILNKLSGKKPVVLEFHEVVDPLENSLLPIRIYSRISGKIVRSFAKHFVVHSYRELELISKVYKIPKNKITVIPHGVYDHYEKVEKKSAKKVLKIEEDFVILFFGLLRPYKGVKYLIKAFEKLPKGVLENSRLLIVGETWEDRESVNLAKKSKVREKITIINRYVPDDEVSIYFSASDVLVLPYTRASQSGVAHIAMAFGLPIIATKVGGLSETLSLYEGTYFVRPKNPNDIVSALLDIYKSRSNVYTPPESLKWSNIAKSWKDLFEKLTE